MTTMNYAQQIVSTPVVLVEFFADWCPHCQKMMPVVNQVKELLTGKVDVYQFEIDHNKQLAEAQGIESIPTFIIYSDGKEKWRYSGEIDADILLGKIQSYMK